MKSGESKVALLTIAEHIEMDLLYPKGPCVVMLEQDQEQSVCQEPTQKQLEHPLCLDCEDEPTAEVQTRARTASGLNPHELQPAEPVHIEMEIFPLLRVMECEMVELKSDDPSVLSPWQPSPNKRSRRRWKRLSLQKTGLVVKDVVCLPGGRHVAHLDRHVVPQGKEREALSAMGLTARITIDCGWSAGQMLGRLVVLFQSRSGQRFSFTYLQCVQGSRVLFVPDAPADGWTAAQVLRVSGHGPLYVLGHLDGPQAGGGRSGSETRAVSRQEFCAEARSQSGRDGDRALDRRTLVCRTTEEFPLDLETVLRLFRQENVDAAVETHVEVTRRNLLRSALTVLRRPRFCFRSTPVVSFSGEGAGSHQEPLSEFFRLTLLELQRSPIFEGRPGRLFITYDLTALGDRKYYEAGVLIGWSLVHGGPGPRCLHPVLYQLMCGSRPSWDDLACADVVDAELQMRLRQLHRCTDVKLPLIPGPSSARPGETAAACARLAECHVYHRVASMISQFKDGLNSCGGLWDTIQANWQLFVPVMTSVWQQPLTPDEFKRLVTVCYSRSDSRRRERPWDTGKRSWSPRSMAASLLPGSEHVQCRPATRLRPGLGAGHEAGASHVSRKTERPVLVDARSTKPTEQKPR